MFYKIRKYIKYILSYKKNCGISFKEAMSLIGSSFKYSMNLTGLPIITIKNIDTEGKKRYMNFMLDTGATFSIINKSAIERSHYIYKGKTLGMITASTVDNDSIYDVIEMDLYFNDKKLVEDFSVIDMAAIFEDIKKESGITVHGLLSAQFLKKYKFIINFNNLRIY